MQDVWTKLKNTGKPIALYGMGDGADKVLSVFSRYGIEAAGVFASDGFARGNLFHGFPVRTYRETCDALGDFCVVVSFASGRVEVIENLLRIASERETCVPDLPVAGDRFWTAEFAESHADELAEARSLLCDRRSREVFDLVCEARTSGRIEPLFASADADGEAENILRPERYRSCADLGAYTGDTLRRLTARAPSLETVYAVEPDRRSFAKLRAFLESSGLRFTAVQAAAWNTDGEYLPFEDGSGRGSALGKGGTSVPAVRLDTLIGANGRVDYIKYDVEGSEYEALEGSRATVERCRPDLRVALYHRPEDIFKLTLAVRDMLPGHRLYIRRARSFPCWDLDLFAVGE